MKNENLRAKAAVIGSPISHSLSPFIFSFIAQKESCLIDYQSIEVTQDQSKEFINNVSNQADFIGCNVTLPLKEALLSELDFISPEVHALGALNVLHFKNKKIHGFNTDIVGIAKTFSANNFPVEGKTCFLLGAGGSAKAVAYVLGSQRAKEIIIYNRSNRNLDLVEKFKKLFPDVIWRSTNRIKCDHSIDLIINSTPIGMTGKDSGIDFFQSLKVLNFSTNALAFDLIYTPEQTEFIKVAKSLGLRTVGGLGMLIDQALATWKIWIGELKDEKKMHLELRDFLNGILWIRQSPQKIYLTGFMGVGKSSVGIELGTLLKRDFIDTDKVIQDEAHLTITEIFAQKGEAVFREMESRAINHLSKNIHAQEAVVSLGGGALMNSDNLQAVTKSGLLIYLEASAEVLLERINTQNQTRPLLANLSSTEQLKKINDLLMLRKNIYEQAPIRIQTNEMSIKEICFEILSAIGKYQAKDNR